MKKILFASLVTGSMFLGSSARAELTHSVADCAPADGKTIEALFGAKLPTLNQKAVNFALSGEGVSGWLYNGYALAGIFKPTNTLTKPSYRTINNGQEECTYMVMNGASQVGSMALIVVEQAAPAATEPAAEAAPATAPDPSAETAAETAAETPS